MVNTADTFKKLPFSIQAEQALLGSMMIDPSTIVEVVATVKPDDFFISEHKAIYTAMISLSQASHDIDVVTLMDKLEHDKVYENRMDVESHLKALAEAVPDALNIRDYARIVVEKSTMRQLIDVCGTVSERAYVEGEKADELVEYAAAEISNISAGRNSKGFIYLNQVIDKIYADLQLLSQNPDAFEGIKMGYPKVDHIMGGINNSDLVIVGARPGMGKTSFCLNVGVNVAKMTGKKVAMFSLEMSAEQLASRILSSEAFVDSNALRTGQLTDGDWDRLANAVNDLYKTQILIDDTTNITVSAMKAKLRKEKDIALVVVDYLGLMQGEKHTDNRVLEIGDITRGLKLMAKELHIPILCCSQLSRGTEKNNGNNKRPMLSDLRDSGSIEQDADSVIFIYRDEYYKNEGNKKEEDAAAETETPVAEIIIAKNRHGSTGTAKINWIGKYTAFREFDENRSESDAPPY